MSKMSVVVKDFVLYQEKVVAKSGTGGGVNIPVEFLGHPVKIFVMKKNVVKKVKK